ncbi:MAG: ATP-binding cassette domain-containing protein [Clostridiales bacterium]|nr:ATP-binding cassette domain-containing protein [Clostridiales bacterium]
MLCLSSFEFPDSDREFDFFLSQKRTCYDSFYPFGVLSRHRFQRVDFAPVTVFYGGNGSGKTTALNIIAEKIGAARDSAFNSSPFFPDYLRCCRFEFERRPENGCRIITSDDVFDYMLNLRALNEGIDMRREELFGEFYEKKHSRFRLNSIADYEELKSHNNARRLTQSKFVRSELMENPRERSNGESAFFYFTEKMEPEDSLYLLDEPENSLSPALQQDLVQLIYDGARYFGCQFILSTHSPFLLALPGAKIYDLDADPVDVKKWTELPNVRTYYDFFKAHEREFTES